MKKLIIAIAFLWGFLNVTLQAQQPTIHIKKAKMPIVLDGRLDDSDWQMAEKTTPFWQSLPYDTSYAWHQTEVRLTFDDKNLYVGAKCTQRKDKYVVASLKRDFGTGTTDLFGVLIDPFGDKQNAFSFATSPYGVQREGLIANGNTFTTDWDTRWFVKNYNTENEYFVEIAIPFKSLRYKRQDGQNTWFINLLRFDQSMTQPERSTWAALPRFTSGNNIAFSGQLIWETPPPPPGQNIALIPYALANTDRDYINDKPWKSKLNIGADAKIALTSSMNLDLTANPDFAQVEVDKQVTNLSRFELLFPERRQFFLENADLFGNFGLESVNPLFSRRIGLAKDKAGNTVGVPIAFGARLTGKLNKNWRLGILEMQTANQGKVGIAPTNFFATAIQRKIWTRSLWSFVAVNRQNFLADSSSFLNYKIDNQGFNRILGTDFVFASKDSRWYCKSFVHASFSPGSVALARAATAYYQNNRFNFYAGIVGVDADYRAEAGYVPRTDYWRSDPRFAFTFFPKSNLINNIGLGTDADIYIRKSDTQLTDWDYSPLIFTMNFQNNTKFSFTPRRWDYTYLLTTFDPTNTGGKKLDALSSYLYRSSRFNFSTDTRKHLSWTTNGRFGQYFNGKIVSLQNTLSYRYQPYGLFSLDVSYNKIDLPDGYNDRVLWLVGPRADVSFTKTLFLTTFVQYNNQINNVNLNIRFQWRFAPVSDLFLVYTDNYFATDDVANNHRAFAVKSRAMVLKCTYWLNK